MYLQCTVYSDIILNAHVIISLRSRFRGNSISTSVTATLHTWLPTCMLIRLWFGLWVVSEKLEFLLTCWVSFLERPPGGSQSLVRFHSEKNLSAHWNCQHQNSEKSHEYMHSYKSISHIQYSYPIILVTNFTVSNAKWKLIHIATV